MLLPVISAYIDASAVSVVVTSISGLVIVIGASALIIWRKTKKKVADVLHIDENANKEVEEELVINAAPANTTDSTSADQ